jgi:hypothetical protein
VISRAGPRDVVIWLVLANSFVKTFRSKSSEYFAGYPHLLAWLIPSPGRPLPALSGASACKKMVEIQG